MDFNKQLKSPKWQKKRLEILERDNYTCQCCGNKEEQLHVHHYVYRKNTDLWDYEDGYLVTFCNSCHEEWHWNNDFIKQKLCVPNLYTHGLLLDLFDELDSYKRSTLVNFLYTLTNKEIP